MNFDGLRVAVFGNLTQRVIFGIFVALNGLLIIFSVPDGPYVAGADVAVSIEPARSLLEGKGFVHPDGRPFTWGTPLYPVFLSVFIGLFPWEIALIAIVFVQCALLYSIGLMTRSMTSFILPKAGTLAQILLVFNPNILITAHLLQTEILFTFLLTGALLLILSYGKAPSLSKAVIAGVLVGAATLVRPVGQFVILLLPALLVIVAAKYEWATIRRSLSAGVVSLLIAGLTVSPWVLRNYIVLGESVLTTNAGFYLAAQYRQLLHTGHGMAEFDTLAASAQLEKLYVSRIGLEFEGLGDLPRAEQSRILSSVYRSAIVAEPVAIHAKAFLESWALLYVGGGASNIRNYLGLGSSDSIVQYDREGRTGIIDAISRFLSRIDTPYTTLLILTFGFTIALRVAGLVGLFRMLRTDTRHVTHAMLVIVVLLSMSYLYLGQSRFRVPLEPFLATMAAIGFVAFREQRWNGRKKRGTV